MWAICTKCGEESHWYAGRGMKLKDARSKCCGAPMKSKPKKKPNRIERPYARIHVVRQYVYMWGTEAETQHYGRDELMNVYLAEDGVSVHFAGQWIKGQWRKVPITMVPTDKIREVIFTSADRDTRQKREDKYRMRLFVCEGHDKEPVLEKNSYGDTYLCAHCGNVADWCRKDTRYWVEIDGYEKLKRKVTIDDA